MFKEYDGDGIETPVTYELKESFKGEARQEILERFCFDTALYDEYEINTDNGEATLTTKEWITPFEVMQLNLISDYSKNEFWEDITVEKLDRILNSHRELFGVKDEREVA